MKGKIEIDRELCKGCAYCVITCPKKIIDIDKKFNSAGYYPAVCIRPEECTGCALCAEICPEIAIEVWKAEAPNKGEGLLQG